MDLGRIFEILGYKKEQAVIYQTLLQNGRMRIIEIGKKTKLPRTSCYEYLPDLINSGIVREIQRGKSKFYEAEMPKVLLDLLYKVRTNVSLSLNTFESQYDDIVEEYYKTYGYSGIKEVEGSEKLLILLRHLQKQKNVYLLINTFLDSRISGLLIGDLKYFKKNGKCIEFREFNEDHNLLDSNTCKIVSEEAILVINFEKESGVIIEDKNLVNLEMNYVRLIIVSR